MFRPGVVDLVTLTALNANGHLAPLGKSIHIQTREHGPASPKFQGPVSKPPLALSRFRLRLAQKVVEAVFHGPVAVLPWENNPMIPHNARDIGILPLAATNPSEILGAGEVSLALLKRLAGMNDVIHPDHPIAREPQVRKAASMAERNGKRKAASRLTKNPYGAGLDISHQHVDGVAEVLPCQRQQLAVHPIQPASEASSHSRSRRHRE